MDEEVREWPGTHLNMLGRQIQEAANVPPKGSNIQSCLAQIGKKHPRLTLGTWYAHPAEKCVHDLLAHRMVNM